MRNWTQILWSTNSSICNWPVQLARHCSCYPHKICIDLRHWISVLHRGAFSSHWFLQLYQCQPHSHCLWINSIFENPVSHERQCMLHQTIESYSTVLSPCHHNIIFSFKCLSNFLWSQVLILHPSPNNILHHGGKCELDSNWLQLHGSLASSVRSINQRFKNKQGLESLTYMFQKNWTAEKAFITLKNLI